MNDILDFSKYFNIYSVDSDYPWSYLRRIDLFNLDELYTTLNVSKIQIIINSQLGESIYLDEYRKNDIKIDIYLNNGDNNLCFILYDNKNNILQQFEYIVNVNIFSHTPDNEKLLTNFIGNDDQMISLCAGNSDLRYSNPDVGENKQVIIDLDIASHYFKLEGVNSELYQISKDNIPSIKSTIMPRPLSVTFNEVSKMYDGNCDITNEVNKLELNNGYKFNNINVEYNDFGNTGFIKEMFEYNINKTILYKQYDEIPNETLLNTTSLDINSLKLEIDNKQFNVNEEFDLNDVSTWHLTYDTSTFINSKALKESTCKNILNGKYPYNKICWYEKEISQIDGTVKLLYIAIDPIGCYEDKVMIKNPITYQNTDFNKVEQWMKAFNHKIVDFSFYRNKDNYIIMTTNYLDKEKYKVEDKVIIEYNYANDKSKNIYLESDYGYVKVNYDCAYFENKNVEDNKKPVRLFNSRLEGDIKGDHSKNYQIANYTIVGQITKRPIYPHIIFIDKIYDGTTNVAFRMDSAYYNGLENAIIGDDIKIDTKCIISDKTKDGKVNVETGLTTFYFNDPNVGKNKLINLGNIVLEGKDSINYTLLNPISNFIANVTKRPIKIKINRIKLYRTDLRWEVNYEFDDDISSDNLTISINSNDIYQFIVYARKISEDNKLNEYDTQEILSTYFTYDHNNDYKFENPVDNKEIKLVENLPIEKPIYYNVEKAMPAEPNTKRINVTPEQNKNYTGNVVLNPSLIKDSFSIKDEFDNTKQYNISNIISSFYESQDKESKIYSGCKVKITNICLDPNNSKSSNYELLNTETETILEII